MTRFIALDFETSGLDPQRHAPVSIGVALFEDGEVGPEFEMHVGPTRHWKTQRIEREYDLCALEVSGASWPKIKSSPPPAHVVHELRCHIDNWEANDLPVVAFNAPFDFAFYSQLLFMSSDWHPTERGVRVQPVPPLCGPWYCAKMLARRELQLTNYSLDDVAAYFGLSRTGDKHGALEDAILAGRIYDRLTETGAKERSSIADAPAAPLSEGTLL